MLRIALAWCVWAALGAFAASQWLDGSCPPGGCSGILVLLELPRFAIAAIAWFILGIGGTGALAVSESRKTASRSFARLQYADGQEIELGDEVTVLGEQRLQGKIIQLAGIALPEAADEPRLASAKTGFVLRTPEGEFHHFPGKSASLLLRRPPPSQNAI